MSSKFKISESEKNLKVGFNWLSKDLLVLLGFFIVCFLSFLFFGYAIINAEKVPVHYFLLFFGAVLIIGYLGFATFQTLFNRTFFSFDEESLIVKRKPFFGLEYPASIPLANLDQILQKNYLFFYYKVIAQLKDGAQVPVFSYHYYDASVFKDLKRDINHLVGRKEKDVISIVKETEENTKPPINDLNIYEKQQKGAAPKKKVFKIKKKPAASTPDYPGTQPKSEKPTLAKPTLAKPKAEKPAPAPVKKQRKKKPAAKTRKSRRTATSTTGKEQLVPLQSSGLTIDQVVYLEEVLHYVKRVFHYHFDTSNQDKVFQLAPKNNRRRSFFLEQKDQESVIYEEKELDYNDAKEIGFNTADHSDEISFEGLSYELSSTKSGFSKSLETGNEVEIKQWVYHPKIEGLQLRIVEGDRLVKIFSGLVIKKDSLKLKK